MLSYEITKDGGILVTGISPQFKEFKSLNLSIPSDVSSLAPSAFEGCDNLESVEFACSVKEIPEKLFCGCTHLKEATFAKGCNALKRIGKSAFARCANLKRIKLPDTVETNDDLAFSDSGLAKFVVSKGLKSLSLKAFEGCSNLKNVDGESNTYWTSFDCLFKGPKVDRYPVAGLFKKAKLKKIRQMELPILLFCFDGQTLFPVDDPKGYKYDVELNEIPYFIGGVDVNAFSLFNLGRKFGRVFFPPEFDVIADVPHSVVGKLETQGVHAANHD